MFLALSEFLSQLDDDDAATTTSSSFDALGVFGSGDKDGFIKNRDGSPGGGSPTTGTTMSSSSWELQRRAYAVAFWVQMAKLLRLVGVELCAACPQLPRQQKTSDDADNNNEVADAKEGVCLYLIESVEVLETLIHQSNNNNSKTVAAETGAKQRNQYTDPVSDSWGSPMVGGSDNDDEPHGPFDSNEEPNGQPPVPTHNHHKINNASFADLHLADAEWSHNDVHNNSSSQNRGTTQSVSNHNPTQQSHDDGEACLAPQHHPTRGTVPVRETKSANNQHSQIHDNEEGLRTGNTNKHFGWCAGWYVRIGRSLVTTTSSGSGRGREPQEEQEQVTSNSTTSSRTVASANSVTMGVRCALSVPHGWMYRELAKTVAALL